MTRPVLMDSSHPAREAVTHGNVEQLHGWLNATAGTPEPAAGLSVKTHEGVSPILIFVANSIDWYEGQGLPRSTASSLARLLLQHGADPNALGPVANSAIAEASARGDACFVRLLLRHGAKPWLGRSKAMLLAAGGGVEVGGRSAVCPAAHVCQSSHYIEFSEVVLLLLAHGPPGWIIERYPSSPPLLGAPSEAKKFYYEVTSKDRNGLLLPPAEGMTALVEACYVGNDAIVETLLIHAEVSGVGAHAIGACNALRVANNMAKRSYAWGNFSRCAWLLRRALKFQGTGCDTCDDLQFTFCGRGFCDDGLIRAEQPVCLHAHSVSIAPRSAPPHAHQSPPVQLGAPAWSAGHLLLLACGVAVLLVAFLTWHLTQLDQAARSSLIGVSSGRLSGRSRQQRLAARSTTKPTRQSRQTGSVSGPSPTEPAAKRASDGESTNGAITPEGGQTLREKRRAQRKEDARRRAEAEARREAAEANKRREMESKAAKGKVAEAAAVEVDEAKRAIAEQGLNTEAGGGQNWSPWASHTDSIVMGAANSHGWCSTGSDERVSKQEGGWESVWPLSCGALGSSIWAAPPAQSLGLGGSRGSLSLISARYSASSSGSSGSLEAMGNWGAGGAGAWGANDMTSKARDFAGRGLGPLEGLDRDEQPWEADLKMVAVEEEAAAAAAAAAAAGADAANAATAVSGVAARR